MRLASYKIMDALVSQSSTRIERTYCEFHGALVLKELRVRRAGRQTAFTAGKLAWIDPRDARDRLPATRSTCSLASPPISLTTPSYVARLWLKLWFRELHQEAAEALAAASCARASLARASGAAAAARRYHSAASLKRPARKWQSARLSRHA